MGKGAKTAAKTGPKVRRYVIGPDGKQYDEKDLVLARAYNERGGNPRMMWYTKDYKITWPKVKGDVHEEIQAT